MYHSIYTQSLRLLAHYPALILFGLPIALSSILPQPFGYLGWPNVLGRLVLQYVLEPAVQLALPSQITFPQYLEGFLLIARADTGAFIRLLITVAIILTIIVLIILGIPRAVAALIEVHRAVQGGERVSIGAAWSRGRTFRAGFFLFLIILPLIPSIAVLAFRATTHVLGSFATLGVTLAVLAAFVVITSTCFACAFRILGGYETRDALRAGLHLVRTRLGTLLEWGLLLLLTDVVGMSVAFVAGSIAFVPIALLLVIFWVLKWGTLFAWLLTATFFLILLYTFIAFLVLIVFEYSLWINFFYACTTTHDTSVTRRTLRRLRQWWKRRGK